MEEPPNFSTFNIFFACFPVFLCKVFNHDDKNLFFVFHKKTLAFLLGTVYHIVMQNARKRLEKLV